jgi:hypothetical protein
MTKDMTIGFGALGGCVLGLLGGTVFPCTIYPDSNMCGIFGGVTMPAGAVIGAISGMLVWQRSVGIKLAVALGATLGTLAVIVPALLFPKSAVSSLFFLVFPVTTMAGGAAIGGFLASMLSPSRRSEARERDEFDGQS